QWREEIAKPPQCDAPILRTLSHNPNSQEIFGRENRYGGDLKDAQRASPLRCQAGDGIEDDSKNIQRDKRYQEDSHRPAGTVGRPRLLQDRKAATAKSGHGWPPLSLFVVVQARGPSYPHGPRSGRYFVCQAPTHAEENCFFTPGLIFADSG